MSKRPLILVSPSIETKGIEFSDMSLSLSLPYERALINAGALPWAYRRTPPRFVGPSPAGTYEHPLTAA